jgi:uncharacterized cupredoxin-like copper-binding protein
MALISVLDGCGSSGSDKLRPPDGPPPPEVSVTLTKTGCSPQNFRLKAGYVIFKVTNPPTGDSGIGLHDDKEGRPTEMEVQNAQGHAINDVEGVQPGHTRSFLVKLEAGKTYRAACPEDQKPWGTITVTP